VEPGIAKVSWALERGRLSFSWAGPCWVELRGIAPRVRLHHAGNLVDWIADALTEEGGRYRASRAEPALALEWVCREEGSACTLRLEIENRGNEPVRVEELCPLSLAPGGEAVVGAGADRLAVLRNGYQSWSGTRVQRLGETDLDPAFSFLRVLHTDPRHPAAGRSGVVRSDLFTALKNARSGEILCLGFVSSADSLGAVLVRHDEERLLALDATCDFDNVVLPPGGRLVSESLWMAAGRDEQALLERWAETLGRTMKARTDDSSPVGWCSWYEDFGRVNEDAVLRNLDAVSRIEGGLPFDYVMVDDGWQKSIGDWLEWNGKFPHGMPQLAEHIRSRALHPGIWLAPFLARPESDVFRSHRDWFVRAPGGGPLPAAWNPAWGWRRPAYALDTTKPAVQEWLAELARALVHDWGYPILKLDFLFAAALPGEREDGGATRAQALRRGLEAIRAGAGDEAFLIGCGCPLGPAVGVVDAMRIGPDVAPHWTNWLSRGPLRGRHGVATLHALRSVLLRSFLHRRLWLNDPDCILARAARSRLSLEEVRTLATAVGLSGGLFVVGDRIDRLPDDRLAVLRTAHGFSSGRSRTVGLLDHDPPELLLSERAGEIVLAAFNFGDRPRSRSVVVGDWGVSDGVVSEVWTGAALKVRDGWLDLGEIPPHGCRVAVLGTVPIGTPPDKRLEAASTLVL
jgi:alpha-galactosidase